MASLPSSSILPKYASSTSIDYGAFANYFNQNASASAAPAPATAFLQYQALPGNGYKEEYVPCPTFNHRLNRPTGHLMVTFESIETATKKTITCNGTSMKQCLDGTGLLDPDTHLFSALRDTGKESVVFILTWPGYPMMRTVFSIYGRSGLKTRAELAFAICRMFQEFIQRVCVMPSREPRWRIGVDGITFERLRLAGFWNVEDDIWQASVRVNNELPQPVMSEDQLGSLG